MSDTRRMSLVGQLMAKAKVRRAGERPVVTIRKELAAKEKIKTGETADFDVRRVKKSYFGTARRVGPFTSRDEMRAHD